MRLLLDTHIFLWYVTYDPKLPTSFEAAIRNPANKVFLSVVSQWEATIKHDLGKMPLPRSADLFFPFHRRSHRMSSLELTEGSVARLSGLPLHHRDPFDRMLIAQALADSLTIVTVDTNIKKYSVSFL